jgi:DNA-binding response OmpR family regulator
MPAANWCSGRLVSSVPAVRTDVTARANNVTARANNVTARADNPGKLFSQQQLLTSIWGPTYVKETHYLRQYMAQLRRKLEDDPSHPRHLQTKLGMGYRFRPSDQRE